MGLLTVSVYQTFTIRSRSDYLEITFRPNGPARLAGHCPAEREVM